MTSSDDGGDGGDATIRAVSGRTGGDCCGPEAFVSDRPGDWRVLIVGSEASDLAFFYFFLSDFCVWQGCSDSATFSLTFPVRVSAAWMDLRQWWLTPKSSSWLATSTLCPNRGASSACRPGIPSASSRTPPKADTGMWSRLWK